jgi:hypothetical protein
LFKFSNASYIFLMTRAQILLFFLLGVGLSLAAAEPSATDRVLKLGWGALKGFGVLIGKSLISFILWSILGLISGAMGGVFLWRWLRDRGWLEVPWGWYRYVRWIWPVLIVASLSLGLSCSLGTWGAGRKMKAGMREGKLIETAVVNAYSAVMVWRIQGADDNATSSLLERDLAEGLAKLKDTTGVAGDFEDKTLKLILEKIDQESGGAWYEKWFYRKMLEVLWDQQIKEGLADQEIVEVVKSTLEAGKASGESAAVVLAKQKIIAGVHVVLDETVNSVVYSTFLTVIPIAMGVPLLPLSIFWLVRWLWLRKHPPDSSDSDLPPVLDEAPSGPE